jgi:hypothetical protein
MMMLPENQEAGCTSKRLTEAEVASVTTLYQHLLPAVICQAKE